MFSTGQKIEQSYAAKLCSDITYCTLKVFNDSELCLFFTFLGLIVNFVREITAKIFLCFQCMLESLTLGCEHSTWQLDSVLSVFSLLGCRFFKSWQSRECATAQFGKTKGRIKREPSQQIMSSFRLCREEKKGKEETDCGGTKLATHQIYAFLLGTRVGSRKRH